jgi:hypothetical protein
MNMGAFLALLALNLVGFLVVWLLLRDRVRRYASPAAQTAELRAEVDRLVVELNQTTERNILLLEDRIAGLTAVLAQADKRMELLRREAEKREIGARVYARLGESRKSSLEAGGPSPMEETMARSVSDEFEKPPPPNIAEPRQEEVVRLHKAGFSSTLIAGKTGVPRGEVELIISLEEGKERT